MGAIRIILVDDHQLFRAGLRALEPGTVGVLHAPALALDIDTPDDLRAAHELGLIDD